FSLVLIQQSNTETQSFPTRRSSDLRQAETGGERCGNDHGDDDAGKGRPEPAQHDDDRQGEREDREGGRIEARADRPQRLETGERSEEHTSELQSRENLVCCLLLEKK